jgi:hypothetical protein
MIKKITDKQDIKILKCCGMDRFVEIYEKIDEIINEVNKLKMKK